VTCDSPDAPAESSGSFKNDAFIDGSESDVSDMSRGAGDAGSGDVIAQNGVTPPTLSLPGSGSPEKRRQSAVTFNETTQIIQIARNKK